MKAQKKLKAALTKAFVSAREAIADQVARAYADHFGKAESDDARIEAILSLVDFEDAFDGIPAAVVGSLKVTAKDGARLANEQIKGGVSLDLMNDMALDYANNRAAEMVGKKLIDGKLIDNPNAKWNITEGTRDYLRTAVSDAIENGLSTDDLRENIMDNQAFSADRADKIARTETARAHVEGNMLLYREAGVSKKVWILGGNPCPVCVGNSEQGAILIDEDFESGDNAPPAHPNCVCDIVPVQLDDEN